MRDADPQRDAPPATATKSSQRSPGSQRISGRLTALSSAAVLAIYTAGYLQTKSASDRFALAAAGRRQAAPIEVKARVAPQSALPAAAEATAPDVGVVPPRTAARDHTPTTAAAPSGRIATQVSMAPAPVAPAAAPAVPSVAAAPPPAAPALAPTTLAAPVGSDGLSTVAQAAPAATLAAPAPVGPFYKDGTYSGWGTSRHGDIEATIVVSGGKITSSAISQCYTRWPCSWVSVLVPQVVARQSAEVDFVTGASHSTNAFYYAVVEALKKAK